MVFRFVDWMRELEEVELEEVELEEGELEDRELEYRELDPPSKTISWFLAGTSTRVKLSSQDAYENLLERKDIQCLVNPTLVEIYEYKNLVDGEVYAAGPKREVACQVCQQKYPRDACAAHILQCMNPSIKGAPTWALWVILTSSLSQSDGTSFPPVPVTVKLDAGSQAHLIITPDVAHLLGISQDRCEQASLGEEGTSSSVSCLRSTQAVAVSASHNGTTRSFTALPYVCGDRNLVGLPGMSELKIVPAV